MGIAVFNLVVFLFLAVNVIDASTEMPKTFLYFGYGSNLLTRRILINNPTAVRYAVGKLQGYELDFYGRSLTWDGAPATIVPQPGSDVWGAVWELREEDKDHLDDQEGVHVGLYEAMEVTVESPTKGNLTCRSYKLQKQPQKLRPGEARPTNRIPSRMYLEVILQGALESGLPSDYFQFLKKFPHNGSSGGPNVPIRLEYEQTTDNEVY